MSVIYVLIAVSLLIAIVFFAFFIIAVKNGQFDDPYTPSIRMLFDANKPTEKNKSKSTTKE